LIDVVVAVAVVVVVAVDRLHFPGNAGIECSFTVE